MFFSFQYLSMGLVFPVDTCRFVNRSSTAIIKADTSVVFFCKDLFRSENFGGDKRMKLRGTHEQCFKKWSIQGNGGFDVLYCSSREQLERKDTNLGNNLRQEYSEHYGSLERQACGEHTGVLFPGEGTGTKRQKQQGKTAFSQMDLIKSTSNRKNNRMAFPEKWWVLLWRLVKPPGCLLVMDARGEMYLAMGGIGDS